MVPAMDTGNIYADATSKDQRNGPSYLSVFKRPCAVWTYAETGKTQCAGDDLNSSQVSISSTTGGGSHKQLADSLPEWVSNIAFEVMLRIDSRLIHDSFHAVRVFGIVLSCHVEPVSNAEDAILQHTLLHACGTATQKLISDADFMQVSLKYF